MHMEERSDPIGSRIRFLGKLKALLWLRIKASCPLECFSLRMFYQLPWCRKGKDRWLDSLRNGICLGH